MRYAAAWLCAAVLAGSTPAAAQAVSRPGPWALDVRGVTSPVPDATVFYPPLDVTAVVPSRGVGLDVGAHVYLFNLGAARVGLGLNALNVRAVTTPPAPTTTGTATPPPRQEVQVDLRVVAPQVSFNFGTRSGWSYVSAGAGVADVVSRTAGVNAARRQTDGLNALNFGGGARWFFLSHLAFTFDVRFHRIAAGTAGIVEPGSGTGSGTADPAPLPATPGTMVLMVGAGLSLR